jgi:hypothetical protein
VTATEYCGKGVTVFELKINSYWEFEYTVMLHVECIGKGSYRDWVKDIRITEICECTVMWQQQCIAERELHWLS